MQKLSVVLATRNEEENIGRCLESVKDIADEIIIVDEYSTDKTPEIARSFGAKVFGAEHEAIFHKTKQKALDYATGDWILQLDADEIVTQELAREIRSVVKMTDVERGLRKASEEKEKLFKRHRAVIEQRDGPIGSKVGEVTAFFIPRVNLFLGNPLIHAGVYPDGVIRLLKKGRARFPGRSVHEQIQVDGKVGWLFNDLVHNDSPTLKKYFYRFDYYTDLKAQELRDAKTPKNILSFVKFTLLFPGYYFLLRYFRHKGFLDGARGFLWSFFSAIHFPIGYFKYLTRYT